VLTSLHIENIAVIKCADIDFTSGLTALTGETGAGKSLLLDSISLLLGSRSSKDLIRSGEEKAFVSAIFCNVGDAACAKLAENDIYPDEEGCFSISRAVYADGRSQTKINGRAVTVALQRELAAILLCIHGQHDSRALLDPSAHIEFLDGYADNAELLDEYRGYYSEMNSLKEKIKSLTMNEREKNRRLEQLRFQISDIDGAKLKVGEEEALEAEKRRVRNFEKLSKQTNLAVRALYRSEKGMPAYELVRRSAEAIQSVSDCISNSEDIIKRLNDVMYELEDIGLTIENEAPDGYDDPVELLDRIENRLDLIEKLKRKYGSDIAEIKAFRDESAKELEDIESAEDTILELTDELMKIGDMARETAKKLSERRKSAAEVFEKKLTEELAYLEMPKVRFKIGIEPKRNANGTTELGADGGDTVEFLFSANPGEPLKPMSRIASGGELSRIMLAMKTAGRDKTGAETLIFDEIDSGVSGRTARKIGLRLRQLAETAQIFCVTHSAQVASCANNQYLIEKREKDGRVETSLRYLDREGRINEIARIMGGIEITDNLIETAREMIISPETAEV